mgnify:CR=1 FL=1
MSDAGYGKIIRNGLWTNNTALVALLGLCPLLATSNTLINGLGLDASILPRVVESSEQTGEVTPKGDFQLGADIGAGLCEPELGMSG